MKVSVLDAKDRLPELIEAAQAGEEVVIAGKSESAVRLVPVPAAVPEEKHPVGSAAGILDWLKNRPPPNWKQRSPEEIDADIRAERDAWD